MVLGPYATQILGDYGADVIKVEPPQGDLMRKGGAIKSADMGALYLQLNRNKRSIVLDLKQAAARDALLRLCESADVLVHNNRPAAMRRLKLTDENVRAVNPRLIYVSLIGYGETGPYAGKPAYDDLIQGICRAAGDRRASRCVGAALRAADADRPHRRHQCGACDPRRRVPA